MGQKSQAIFHHGFAPSLPFFTPSAIGVTAGVATPTYSVIVLLASSTQTFPALSTATLSVPAERLED